MAGGNPEKSGATRKGMNRTGPRHPLPDMSRTGG